MSKNKKKTNNKVPTPKPSPKEIINALKTRGFIEINGKKFYTVPACYFKCHCFACDIDFFVNDDWPYHVQQREGVDDSTEEPLLSDMKNYYGLLVFEVYCPRCGQKLMFSKDDTPCGELNWKQFK